LTVDGKRLRVQRFKSSRSLRIEEGRESNCKKESDVPYSKNLST